MAGGGHQVIMTVCFDASDLREGDIIVYQHESSLILHQILDVRPDGVVTKGIGNEILDCEFLDIENCTVLWEDIIALVVGVIY